MEGLTRLRWRDVRLDDEDVNGNVVGTMARDKTGQDKPGGRPVTLRPTPGLRELLARMRGAVGDPDSPVFPEITKDVLTKAYKRLRQDRFGAPAGSNLQACRVTAATVMVKAKGLAMTTEEVTDRTGHSEATAKGYYREPGYTGIDPAATTLEEAMGIAAILARYTAGFPGADREQIVPMPRTPTRTSRTRKRA